MSLTRAQQRSVAKKATVKNKIIVAIDPASRRHQVEIISPKGIPMDRSFKIFNTGQGFKRLCRKLDGVKKQYPSVEVLFAIEPSSHYWIPLWKFFKKRGYTFVFVPSLLVKRSREIEDHTSRKDDPKDAHLVGELTLQGKYCQDNQPEGVYAELRTLSNTWCDIIKQRAAVRMRIRAMLDIYFPEFIGFLSDFLGATGRYLLSTCPFPKDVLSTNAVTLGREIVRISRSRLDFDKAFELKELAEGSIGIDDGLLAARTRLKLLLNQFEFHKKQLETIAEEIEAYLNCIDYAPFILSLPGVGLVSAAVLLGQTGDLKNYYKPEELISHAGLDLVYWDSGKYRSRRHISRRGRPRLRLILFQITLSFVRHNNIARRKYLNQKLAGKSPTQAIVSSISLFVSILFAVVKQEREYQHLEDSHPLVAEIKKLESQLDKKTKKASKSPKKAA